ncbi:MAG: FIST N-terminal domain-containing protein [Myxococcota bacterium]
MPSAGVGISSGLDARSAAEQAAGAALAGAGGRADAALLFATPAYAATMPELLDAAVETLGTEAVVGASGHGVVGSGAEHEGGACVAVLAQSGLEAQPFLLPDLRGEEAEAGEEIAARLGGPPRPEDLVVVLPDPRGLRAEPLLQGLQKALGPARLVGAGAGDPISGPPLQWLGRRIESGALAGIALRGGRPPRIGVTQACRPATELLTVTRSEGHWILELDGRPALDVYCEVARAPLADDLQRAAAFLLVALPRDCESPLRPGGYLVRHVVGFAPEQRAFALPEAVRRGQRIALVQRDPDAAREDIKAMLSQLGGHRPILGLYFNCCARGSSFFGVGGLEAAYIERAFGQAPIAGMFGSCEIGPIGDSTELLTYTGVLALIDE